DENPTGFRDVEALEQFREGALTRAAAPNDANGGTGCNRARKVAQNFRTVKLIPEADTLEANRTLNSRQAHLAGAQRRFGFGVEQVAESLDRDADLLEVLPKLYDAENRGDHTTREHLKRDELSDGQTTAHNEIRSDP